MAVSIASMREPLSPLLPAGSRQFREKMRLRVSALLWPQIQRGQQVQSTEWDPGADSGTEKCGTFFCRGTPPRKSWPAKWISPRILPMLGGIFGGFLSSTNNRKLVAFTSKISWNASAIMLQSCYIMVYIQKAADSITRMISQWPFWNQWDENETGMNRLGRRKIGKTVRSTSWAIFLSKRWTSLFLAQQM